MYQTNQLATPVKLLIMDVDGVLTDGRIFITASGEEIKSFHTLDGHGLKMLQKTGVKLAIITGRDAPSVAHRVKGLGIDYYFAGIHNKQQTFLTLLEQTGLNAKQCAYIGDDVVDLPVMNRVGFCVAVPQAHPEVLKRAHYVTQAAAGAGAVRELCDLIMHTQGTLDKALAEYLS
ncbi:KdsC family phosphatase [Neisseria sp. Ec49-e6-T10]|uniref:KdsC family phosphatase n=1 Tax=Neisseria sp. Ec49-e6-T10 TaxID=3140744 RepID=UPI003EBBB7F7